MVESWKPRGAELTVREARGRWLGLKTSETWQGYVDEALRVLRGVQGDVYGYASSDEIVVGYALEDGDPSLLLIFSPGSCIRFKMMGSPPSSFPREILLSRISNVSARNGKLIISGSDIRNRYDESLTLGSGGDMSYSIVPKTPSKR